MTTTPIKCIAEDCVEDAGANAAERAAGLIAKTTSAFDIADAPLERALARLCDAHADRLETHVALGGTVDVFAAYCISGCQCAGAIMVVGAGDAVCDDPSNFGFYAGAPCGSVSDTSYAGGLCLRTLVDNDDDQDAGKEKDEASEEEHMADDEKEEDAGDDDGDSDGDIYECGCSGRCVKEAYAIHFHNVVEAGDAKRQAADETGMAAAKRQRVQESQ